MLQVMFIGCALISGGDWRLDHRGLVTLRQKFTHKIQVQRSRNHENAGRFCVSLSRWLFETRRLRTTPNPTAPKSRKLRRGTSIVTSMLFTCIRHLTVTCGGCTAVFDGSLLFESVVHLRNGSTTTFSTTPCALSAHSLPRFRD